MATANAPNVSDPSAPDTGGFFSSFTSAFDSIAGIAKRVGDTATAVRPLWGSNPAMTPNNNAPTYVGAAQTTGSVTGTAMNYTPLVIGAAILVVLVLMVKK